MLVAVVGSRNVSPRLDISKYMPEDITGIVSGGARGVDRLAEMYADEKGLSKRIIKPDYHTYNRMAPLVRNKEIVAASDMVIALWNGYSRGTMFTVDYAKEIGKPVRVFLVSNEKI